MEKKKKRIAGYLRISVDTEADRENTSIENQREIIKSYVAQKFPDAQLDFYADRDRSGYTFEQRENYQQMRPLLMQHEYDILIIKDFSRFSRRNSRGLVELEDLRDAGVRIISIGDGIDYPTYDDWNNIQVRFLLNEMPVTDASKKVKRVIESRQSGGKWVCAVPYGYYITNSKNMTFAVDEQAADIVKKVYELYIGGWGYKKIANYLTDEGIPTPRMIEKERREADGSVTKIKASPVWAIPSVQGILTNDFYIGTLRQRKYTRTKINGPDKKLDEEEHIIFENNHPAIVDFRTFAKAQEQMKSRTRGNYRGVKKYDTSYSGFLFCGDCGSPMFSMSRPDLAAAYTCGTYHKRGLKGCTSHHTRTDVLDTMLKKYIERVMLHSEAMIAELEKAIQDEPKTIQKTQTTLEMLEVDLARAKEEFKATKKQKIKELIRYEGNEELVEETYAEIEAELQAKIEGLEKQISFATERRNTTIQVNRIAKTAIEIFREIIAKEKLDKGDLALILDRITVYEDHMDITLKPDIAMLLESGTISPELLQQKSSGGNTVNFNWDIGSISNAVIVQKATNQKDKAFGVNVIRGGEPLEIFTDKEGEVILKKYSPIGELGDFAQQYAEALSKASGHIVCIADRDMIIAVSGGMRKDLLEKKISTEMENLIEERSFFVAKSQAEPRIAITSHETGENKIMSQTVVSILSNGDPVGAVIMLSTDANSSMGEVELKLAQSAAGFLGKQMEQ